MDIKNGYSDGQLMHISKTKQFNEPTFKYRYRMIIRTQTTPHSSYRHLKVICKNIGMDNKNKESIQVNAIKIFNVNLNCNDCILIEKYF